MPFGTTQEEQHHLDNEILGLLRTSPGLSAGAVQAALSGARSFASVTRHLQRLVDAGQASREYGEIAWTAARNGRPYTQRAREYRYFAAAVVTAAAVLG